LTFPLPFSIVSAMENGSPGHISCRLMEWYGRQRRDLPWRRTTDPYAIWVSEIMLQQTGVHTVIPFYERFMIRFPTLPALAGASLDDVLKAWENLGYYSRARNLHRAARIVAEEKKGRIPSDLSGLLSLPGIGKYTAGAILSIAFGQRIPAVDGNVRRVLSRVFAVTEAADTPAGEQILEEQARCLMPADEPGTFNQAVMDLGALVCLPKKPRCPSCPLEDFCEGNRRGIQETLPVKATRPPLPTKVFMTALLRSLDGRYLAVRRPERGLLGGLWAFPTIERNNGDPATWLGGQAGVTVLKMGTLPPVRHGYTHFRVVAHPFLYHLREAASEIGEREGHVWLRPGDFDRYALSALDRRIFNNVLPMDNGIAERPGRKGIK